MPLFNVVAPRPGHVVVHHDHMPVHLNHTAIRTHRVPCASVIQGNARAQPLADTVSGIRLGGLHRPASSGWCQSERNRSMSRLGR